MIIIKKGLLEEIPDPLETGRLFYATDTKELFIGTGTDPEKIAELVRKHTYSLTTTNASATPMVADTDITILDDTTLKFEGLITADNTTDDEQAMWLVRGCVVNTGGSSSLFLPVDVTYDESTSAAFSQSDLVISVSANTLILTVTGQLSKTINWTARITADLF